MITMEWDLGISSVVKIICFKSSGNCLLLYFVLKQVQVGVIYEQTLSARSTVICQHLVFWGFFYFVFLSGVVIRYYSKGLIE